MHRGKRYRAAIAQLDRDGLFSPEEAIRLVKQAATAKFDETVELHLRLGVDPRQGDQMVRGTVNLPHGSGKSPMVVAIAKGERAAEAQAAGADVVGAEDVIQRIQEGWKDFDVVVATRDVMGMVGRLGKRLGPRMPNPKSGTVSDEIGRVVAELKKGKVEFRVDRGANVHLPIGKVSFTEEQLLENLTIALAALLRARPAAAKGRYLKRIALSSTMGPSVHLNPDQATEATEKAA